MPIPALQIAPELLLKAQSVRVAFFDVDGVLTDGGLYFSEHLPVRDLPHAAAETIKRFNTLDGHGLKLLQRAGLTPESGRGRLRAIQRWQGMLERIGRHPKSGRPVGLRRGHQTRRAD